jgi:hypothetical protein
MNGLWACHFMSSAGEFGAGVVAFRDGRVYGGDALYYCIGSYALDGNNLVASVAMTLHGHKPLPVFGPDKSFELKLVGKVDGDRFAAVGQRVGGNLDITIQATRLADLPAAAPAAQTKPARAAR